MRMWIKMIEDYLGQLGTELRKAGADAAIIQDAIYDAQEYLQSEVAKAESQGEANAEAFKRLVDSYGTPEEIAAAYLEAELTVARALRLPEPVVYKSIAGRFFGVLVEPRAVGALFYMLLSLWTGMTYFTIVIAAISLSLGLGILIVGLPVMLLFLGVVRVVSYVEGKIVEALLGVRMPRRPRVVAIDGSVLARIKWWLTDRRTWTTLGYMFLQLPLGIVYFAMLVTTITLSLGLIWGAPVSAVNGVAMIQTDRFSYVPSLWAVPFIMTVGVLAIVALMHLARAIGRLHGAYAKAMLVGDTEEKN